MDPFSHQNLARVMQVGRLTLVVAPAIRHGYADMLAQIMYGSSQVRGSAQRKSVESFLDASLRQPVSDRLDPAVATATVHQLDNRGMQTAAILMAELAPQRTTTAARRLGVTETEVQVAIINGMAVLLTPDQLNVLMILSHMMHFIFTAAAPPHTQD